MFDDADGEYYGPEPTDEEIEQACLAENAGELLQIPGLSFPTSFILTLMRDEITPQDPIYRLSLKRLRLQTGLTLEGIHVIIRELVSTGFLKRLNEGYLISHEGNLD